MSEANKTEAVRDWMASLLARCAVGFLFFFAFIMGCWIAGAGLHDPDTCWLLGVGNHIIDTGNIPRTDPFSWTFQGLAADGTVDYKKLATLDLTSPDPAISISRTPDGRVFVPYQWLTEVIFFLAYKVAGGYSLLVLVDTILVSAMLIGPLMLHRSLRAPILISILLVILGVVASSFHFLARPEVFSYLFLILMFGMIARTRLRIETRRSFARKDRLIAIQLLVLFAVWANMHTGFISGMAVLLAYALCLTIEVIVFRKGSRQVRAMSTAWLMVGGALLGTFLTPFGIWLWKYIPELFFMPINKYIIELKPVNLSNLSDWTYYPYFLLAIVMAYVLFLSAKQWRKRGRMPFGGTFSFAMCIAVFIGGILCLRIIPFSAMFFVGEIGWLLKGYVRPPAVSSEPGEAGSLISLEQESIISAEKQESSTAGEPNSIISGPSLIPGQQSIDRPPPSMVARTNRRLLALLHEASSPAVLFVFSLLGVFLISVRVLPPKIPQNNAGFNAPFQAISYLNEERPAGKVFNDPQYGDMMIWYLVSREKPIMVKDPFELPKPEGASASLPPATVFIDTRFDMYGAPLVEDYNSIVTLKEGWKDTFQRYRFDWAFLPVRYPLVTRLKQDLGWIEIYRDKDEEGNDLAVILKRP